MVSCPSKIRVFLLFANFLKLYHHLYFHYLPKRQLGLYIPDSFTFAIIPLNDCFQPFLTNLVAHYSLSKSTKERGSTDELRIWDHLSEFQYIHNQFALIAHLVTYHKWINTIGGIYRQCIVSRVGLLVIRLIFFFDLSEGLT